ncbi:peptidylglycine alpha-hydroxylating monooxygenase-like isoform X2 [Folsomia candida]|uniref:peptidylglycine alpha-hydroxylating monooxygenase-like isoform X2 n=1 Tax=Folsomia candida TaxID=158441 RepID=UPI0016053C40|nr:peptidylglycine alpha-hydroxylating monooxygenase-like isoform X2 [Folsomia candida]
MFCIAPSFPTLLMLFTTPALLFLISLFISRSSTAEDPQRKQRHLFRISVPDTARINPQGEEYVCTVQRLNLTTEKAIYLEEFVYSFANHGSAHHFLLYGCKSVGRYALENQYWPCNARGKGNLCLERKHIPLGIPQQNSRRDPKFDEPAKFPENVAYGIGPRFEINYLMLEVHFMAERKEGQFHMNGTDLADEISDTPFVDQGRHDNLGLVAHGSTKRPKYLAGMMVMAGVGFKIPRGQKRIHSRFLCEYKLSA